MPRIIESVWSDPSPPRRHDDPLSTANAVEMVRPLEVPVKHKKNMRPFFKDGNHQQVNRSHIFDHLFHGFHRTVCSVTHLVLVPPPQAERNTSRQRGIRKPFVPVHRLFSHRGSLLAEIPDPWRLTTGQTVEKCRTRDAAVRSLRPHEKAKTSTVGIKGRGKN